MELAARIGTMARRGAPLPYDAEVEYLQSANGAYINTNVIQDQKHFFKIDIEALRNEGDRKYFGVYPGGFAIGEFYNKWRFQSTNTGWFTWSEGAFPARKVFEFTKSEILADGVHIGSRSGSSIVNVAFPLMAARINGELNYGAIKVYGVVFYDDTGAIVADFVPVRFTNENGVSEGAFYDRLGVGGKNRDGSPRDDGMYLNEGTGAFGIGPDKQTFTANLGVLAPIKEQEA